MSRSAPGCRPAWFWRYIRWFHRPAQGDDGLDADACGATLAAQGLAQVRPWGRGVDLALFRARTRRRSGARRPAAADPALCRPGRGREEYRGLPRPPTIPAARSWSATARRCASLQAALSGRAFPRRACRGARSPRAYAGADVFVFPSRTDTFGLVMIEALACGTPVAAYPVPGPADSAHRGGRRDEANVSRTAIAAALTRDRTVCARIWALVIHGTRARASSCEALHRLDAAA